MVRTAGTAKREGLPKYEYEKPLGIKKNTTEYYGTTKSSPKQ